MGVVRVLDMCAGSGCIGVALAKAVPEAHVDFAELDPQHLPTIEKNLRDNIPHYSNRLEYHRVVQSDLFKNIAGRYGYIFSNPPYIDPTLDRAEPSVKDFEPHAALYGGENGLALIERIIEDSPNYLEPQGQLWLEHEPEQSSAIQKLAGENGYAATTHLDQYGVERYSILVVQ